MERKEFGELLNSFAEREDISDEEVNERLSQDDVSKENILDLFKSSKKACDHIIGFLAHKGLWEEYQFYLMFGFAIPMGEGGDA